MNTELIPHNTIASMVDNWIITKAKIENAINTLHSAEKSLDLVFGDHCYLPYDISRLDSQKIIKEAEQSIWSSIISKTEIRKYLTTQRQNELDTSIREGKMGEITVENIVSLFRSASANIHTLMEETITEVFELLRPYNTKYKNNQKFAGELGKTVVLSNVVESWRFNGSCFHVTVYKSDKLRLIENGFRLLDGKPHREIYESELQEKINASPDGAGECEYFTFKCYNNGNLHLTFKRLDLVSKMNGIVSKNTLRKAV